MIHIFIHYHSLIIHNSILIIHFSIKSNFIVLYYFFQVPCGRRNTSYMLLKKTLVCGLK